jgi:hypothetical protein
VVVEPNDLVVGAADPVPHVAAHLAQPDQPQLHDVVPSQRSSESVLIVLAGAASRDTGGYPGRRTGMIR